MTVKGTLEHAMNLLAQVDLDNELMQEFEEKATAFAIIDEKLDEFVYKFSDKSNDFLQAVIAMYAVMTDDEYKEFKLLEQEYEDTYIEYEQFLFNNDIDSDVESPLQTCINILTKLQDDEKALIDFAAQAEMPTDDTDVLRAYLGNMQNRVAAITNFNSKNNVYTKEAYNMISIQDMSGNDTYKFKNVSEFSVVDGAKGGNTSGNDTYNIIRADGTITDFSGNDKYNVSKSTVDIEDSAGKDTYCINDNDKVNIKDISGADKYNIVNVKEFGISDGESKTKNSGNDSYTVKNATGVIQDFNGNDKYTLEGADIWILDNQGSETYNAKNTKGLVRIWDGDEASKDKYVLSNVKDAELGDGGGADTYSISDISSSLLIIEQGGNDEYKILNAQNVEILDGNSNEDASISGNDKYSLQKVKGLTITESGGNEVYTLKNVTGKFGSQNGVLEDVFGDDKYNMTSVSDLTIYDISGNDQFIFNLSDNVYIENFFTDDDKYSITSSSDFNILDCGGGIDKYTISSSSNINLKDCGGDDVYTVKSSSNVEINNLDDNYSTGKDKYTVSSSQDVLISDSRGNDTYKISSSDNIEINDGLKKEIANLSGSDNYILTNIDGVTINDQGGDETYTFKNVSGISETKDGVITDIFGNDTYKMTGVSDIKIYDVEGDDKYTFNSSNNVFLKNFFSDDDTYSIVSSKDFEIRDCGSGTDKYTFTKSFDSELWDGGGTDTYKFSSSKNIRIIDKKDMNGLSNDDNYSLTSSDKIYIENEDGNDTYTISKSTDVVIFDDGGKDTYTIKSSNNSIVFDMSDSDDIYKVTSVKNLSLCDGSGNDTYTVNSLASTLRIHDKFGDNDKLTISGLNAKNLVVGFNFGADGLVSGDLILFDKTQKGFIIVENYFAKDDFSKNIGCIEGIYAGKTNVNNSIESYISKMANSDVKYNEIMQNVQAWVTDKGGMNVETILANGNANDVKDLIAVFTGK